MDAINRLRKRSAELTDLHHIMAILQWDQEVLLPDRATRDRANQLATISTLIHQKEVDPTLGKLLCETEDQLDILPDTDQGLVRVMRRSYDQSTKLPEDFVAALVRTTSEALQTWVKARKESDFALFAPFLEKLVAMNRQKADYLGYMDEPYDALLDLHEEGLTTRQVTEMFAGLKNPLVELLAAVQRREQPELVIDPPMAPDEQIKFADKVLAYIGFDFERGRQDRSAHPFSTTLGHHDRRVTNRYRPDSIEFIFSALHEGGHAMYEQGISEKFARTHLDNGVSLGIHEAQSRLWENIIGRSQPFWEDFYPKLCRAFPNQFGNLSVEQFVRAVNAVRPGLIRVEADEVCYNLHVLIRFEIERNLMQDEIKVPDLPALWNEKYRQLLGVDVDRDADGVLQDIHWSHGSFGYFPTYTVGNLAAAQIWSIYCQTDPDFEESLRNGKLNKIRHWLTDKIYRHGSVYQPDVLMKKVTGETLSPSYFIDYLRGKYV